MTQLSGALVAWALIVASGYGGGPPASANVCDQVRCDRTGRSADSPDRHLVSGGQ